MREREREREGEIPALFEKHSKTLKKMKKLSR
jgi:hypothetical protein